MRKVKNTSLSDVVYEKNQSTWRFDRGHEKNKKKCCHFWQCTWEKQKIVHFSIV